MIPAEEFNPYQAPAGMLDSPIRLEPNGNAEIIRRTYLNHEAGVKGFGSLFNLGAIFCGLGVIFTILTLSGFFGGGRALEAQAVTAIAFALGTFFGLGVIYSALGFGLRRLQPWARWTTIVLIGLAILYQIGQVIMALVVNPAVAGVMPGATALQLIIPIYLLYLLVSPKGSMVFSSEYHEIIRMTPHIKYKTSMIVKILLGLIITILLIAIVGGFASNLIPE